MVFVSQSIYRKHMSGTFLIRSSEHTFNSFINCCPNGRFCKGSMFVERRFVEPGSVDKIVKRKGRGEKPGRLIVIFGKKADARRGQGSSIISNYQRLFPRCSFHGDSGITTRPVGISARMFILFLPPVQGCSWTTPRRWRNDRSVELAG